jgi:phosphoserine phosphatase
MAAFDLVTLDMDYTAFLGNSVLYLKKSLGLSERLEEFHSEYREGKISERELNLRQAPLLKVVSLTRAFEALAKGPVIRRIERGSRLLRSHGCDVQMLTFNPFQIFFSRYGINSDISFVCKVNNDHFAEIGDFPENKLDFLKRYCRTKNLDLNRCAHVGDGQNDVATFKEVGYSVALNSSDSSVESVASISLRTQDFMDVANSILHASDLA